MVLQSHSMAQSSDNFNHYQLEDTYPDSDAEIELGEAVETAEVVGDWKLVDLPVITPLTGEEGHTELAKLRGKVYRFQNQWKERGIGNIKFLRNDTTGITRVVMRAEKTGRCLLNHNLIQKEPFCKLQKLHTNSKAWIWTASDFSTSTAITEIFCLRLLSQEDSDRFKIQFDKACASNAQFIELIKESEPKKEEKKSLSESKQKREEQK